MALVDAIASGEVHEDPVQHLAWPIPSAVRLLAGVYASPKHG